MAKLTLALKGEYFDAIKAGTKVEEFRLVTPYWRKRIENRAYEWIELTKGYPKREDAARRLILPWQGFRVLTLTHPHFGPSPVEVFAINVRPIADRSHASGQLEPEPKKKR
ncbi:ASCH domain-containing protein [Pseudomonas cannabina]|uniref:ASCH domain-containing protein n=1 Tax=Pseudomonas cannabina TaxID=86840 RepID=UPI002180880B|nr:ASCH domain-containing protein [Pseudomonas cannabina]